MRKLRTGLSVAFGLMLLVGTLGHNTHAFAQDDAGKVTVTLVDSDQNGVPDDFRQDLAKGMAPGKKGCLTLDAAMGETGLENLYWVSGCLFKQGENNGETFSYTCPDGGFCTADEGDFNTMQEGTGQTLTATGVSVFFYPDTFNVTGNDTAEEVQCNYAIHEWIYDDTVPQERTEPRGFTCDAAATDLDAWYDANGWEHPNPDSTGAPKSADNTSIDITGNGSTSDSTAAATATKTTKKSTNAAFKDYVAKTLPLLVTDETERGFVTCTKGATAADMVCTSSNGNVHVTHPGPPAVLDFWSGFPIDTACTSTSNGDPNGQRVSCPKGTVLIVDGFNYLPTGS